LPSSSEWTSALSANVDDLLNSLQPSYKSPADSSSDENAASPEATWYAGLTEKE